MLLLETGATFLEHFVTPERLPASPFYSAPVALLISHYYRYYTYHRLQYTTKAYNCVSKITVRKMTRQLYILRALIYVEVLCLL